MEVGAVMSRDLVTAPGNASIAEIARIIHERAVGAVVIVDQGRVAGLVTERDVIACVAEGASVDETRAQDRETHDVVFAEPRQSLEEAAQAMVTRGVRHLPVVDGDELVGIVSMRDLTRWSLAELNSDVGELPHIELSQRVLSTIHGNDQ